MLTQEEKHVNSDLLVKFARCMDFDVHGFAVFEGIECVRKKCNDGGYIWWPLEKEGSGFTQLFKGFSKKWI